MQLLLDQTEQEQLNRQFNGRQKFLLVSSIFLLLFGILTLLFAFFFAVSDEVGISYCLICALSGGIDLLFALWGIRLSQKRSIEFYQAEIIVYESKPVLLLAWVCYILGLFVNAAVIGLAVYEDYSCMITTVFLFLLLFSWAAIFSSYRNRRILLCGDLIRGTTAFGIDYAFARSQIKEVSLQNTLGSFAAKDANGRKLFRFENNMINARELFQTLGGTVPEIFTYGWREHWKKAHEIQWNTDQETIQTLYSRQIRTGYRLLFLINIFLFVFLFFFCPTDILKRKYQFFLLQILPLSYFIYAWIFRDVMTWLPISEINASAEWKRHHVGMGFAYIHIFFTTLFLTAPILMRQVNFVTGEGGMWIAVLLLTFLLFGITFRQARGNPYRKLTLAACLFLFLIFSLGVLYALIPAVSHSSSPTHYSAIVENLQNHERDYWDDYYGTILLPDGKKTEIEMAAYAYEAFKNGEPMVVCDNQAPFGIRYIYVHKP